MSNPQNIPEHRSATDVALEASFVEYVLRPTPELEAQWSAWRDGTPDNARMAAEARLYVLAAHSQFQSETIDVPEASKDRIWAAVQGANTQETNTQEAATRKSRSQQQRRPQAWYYWAAAALVIIGCGLGVMHFVGLVSFWSSPTVIAVEATQGTAAQRTVTLPDGSTAVVGAASKLSFTAEKWQQGGAARELTLTGEAFFVVTKQQHAGQPVKFRVRTAEAVVEVLGTQFNVHTRRERTAVVLQEGTVRVMASDGTTPLTELRPNERAEVTARGAVSKRVVRTAVYTSWKDGKLVFEATPLTELARILEDRYDTRVILDNALSDRTFTGAAPLQNLDLLLRAIGESFDVRITRTADVITIAAR